MRSKPSTKRTRQRRGYNRCLALRNFTVRKALRCEVLESRLLLDSGGVLPGEPTDPALPLEPGVVVGRVWNDADGNGAQNSGEIGLGGVTVYSDLNFNGILEAHEPHTVTSFDDPATDFDEGGLYALPNLQPGYHTVRQVIPDRYEQTYPSLPPGYLPPPWGDPTVHVVFVESGQVVDKNINFGNRAAEPGSISGVKWEDANGNAEFDPGERGLAGVTIYADLNNNGVLDSDEPSAVTSTDVSETDFDEAGRYTLTGLGSGTYVIREIVPDGFRQTYPVGPNGGQPDVTGDEFAVVEPERLDLNLAPGEEQIVDVTISVLPYVFVPIEIDVVASPMVGNVINLSGPQLNGGGGQTSRFEIHVLADGASFNGELQFIDLSGGNVIASIPLTINDQPPVGGAHRVLLGPGEAVDGIDFGNQRIETGTGWVTGHKWADLNGNGSRDPNEPGLGGVVIYSDRNFNGVLDPDEPHTVTRDDIPETDFDEGGLYQLELEAGTHWIAEVVPAGFEQTFPNNAVIAIFPPPPGGGAHEVHLVSGDTIERLDFGNRPVENGTVGGRKWLDRNGNRAHDPNEPGWGGVTIYADLNFNGRLDIGEPSTVTMDDIPETDFDEAGLYLLETRPGFQAIREIVPDGSFQTYPISDAASPLEQGAHYVNVESNKHVDGLNFGNQQLDAFPGSVSGRKWEDLNANGVWDSSEEGLGGVTIYSDLNYDGKLDPHEPHTVTMFDNPDTDFDEGGLYALGDLSSGVHVIREVVPTGFVQTYPSPVLAIPNSDAHTVHLAIGEFVDGLNFGNYRREVPPPGDFNADGVVNSDDLTIWQEEYGTDSTGSQEPGAVMDGVSFLLWQRNLGAASSEGASIAPGLGAAAVTAQDVAEGSPTTLPAVDLTAAPRGSSRASSSSVSQIDVEAIDEVFAERSRPDWRPPQITSSMSEQNGESSTLRKWRRSIASQDADEAVSAEFDAALESVLEV